MTRVNIYTENHQELWTGEASVLPEVGQIIEHITAYAQGGTYEVTKISWDISVGGDLSATVLTRRVN